MKIFNIISAITGQKEKETISLIKDHAQTAYDVTLAFCDAFSSFEKKEYPAMEEKIGLVGDLEEKADRLRRQIEENMYSGAFLPGSRSVILDFVEGVDGVADKAEDAARMLSHFEKREIPPDILALIRMQIKETVSCVETLKDAVESIEEVTEMRSAIDRVREKEHESDKVANRIYSMLYSETKDPIVILLLSKFVEFIGDITDRAEDATDSLSLILLMNKVGWRHLRLGEKRALPCSDRAG